MAKKKKTNTEFTITRRSRNIGIGWSNTPVRAKLPSGAYATIIEVPTQPSVVGTIEDVSREFARVIRLHSGGTYYAVRFFVGRTPVDTEEAKYAIEALRSAYPSERGMGGKKLRYLSDAEKVRAQLP